MKMKIKSLIICPKLLSLIPLNDPKTNTRMLQTFFTPTYC